MTRAGIWKELTSVAVIFALLCLALPTSRANAAWIPTRPALDGAKARLVTALERAEVADALQQLGVDRDEAARRVAGLTEEEAGVALARLDSVPAGGEDAVTFILSAALLVFFVLLLTDLLGLTHFYPFTKKR